MDKKQWRRWIGVRPGNTRQGAGEGVYGRGSSMPPPNTLHPFKCGGRRRVDNNSQRY